MQCAYLDSEPCSTSHGHKGRGADALAPHGGGVFGEHAAGLSLVQPVVQARARSLLKSVGPHGSAGLHG